MTIFDKARALGFPLGQYVIVGSGAMEAVGIRKASDLDIAVTPKFYAELRARGSLREEERYDRVFLEAEGVTIIPQLEWDAYPTTAAEAIRTAQIIEGIPFMSFDELKEFKLALGREKDLKDIELIDNYLRNAHKGE